RTIPGRGSLGHEAGQSPDWFCRDASGTAGVSGAALALALAAAAVHALWNVALAREREREAAAAVASVASVAAFAPVAAAVWRVEWAAVPYIAASAALELTYFALLIAAYERAEMSVGYP